MSVFLNKQVVLNELKFINKCKTILKQNKKEFKFFLHSFGCQGNLAESEKIKGMLKLMGYVEINNVKEADFVIFNTCAVRESAQNRVYGNLGSLVHHKRKNNPNMLLAVCGCMVQQNHVKNKIKTIFPDVDLIFGTHSIYKFSRMVYEILTQNKKIVSTDDSSGFVVEGLPISRNNKLKAFVPISYGCNNFCSYCIVPYVKGRERSRKAKYILNEVKQLITNGYKDITLLGQNVNSYGMDLKNYDFDFSKLLLTLNELDGKFRIRFLTSHPKNLTEKLIDTIAICSKICKHIHLPVQSGCNRILKLMNRGYDVENYLKIVNYAKCKIKNLTLTSDFIVGFPGETYEEFKQTLNLVKKIKFINIFNFIYSKRKGTKAAEFVDLISQQEKTKWLGELINCQNQITEEIHKNYVGKIEEVLFENFVKLEKNLIFGRTDGNLLVRCSDDGSNLNKFKKVKIKNYTRTYLIGEIL